MGVNKQLMESVLTSVYEIKKDIDSPQDIRILQNFFYSVQNKLESAFELFGSTSVLDAEEDYLASLRISNIPIDTVTKSGFYYIIESDNITKLPSGVKSAFAEIIYLNSTDIVIKLIDLVTLTSYYTKTTKGGSSVIRWVITTLISGVSANSTESFENKSIIGKTNIVHATAQQTLVINKTATGIPAYKLVYIDGIDATTGIKMCKVYDRAVVPNKLCVGITTTVMNVNTSAAVFSSVFLDNINTSSYAVDTQLYISDNGSLTDVKPAGKVQVVGVVLYTHATKGIISIDIGNEFSVEMIDAYTKTETDDKFLSSDSTLRGFNSDGTHSDAGLDLDAITYNSTFSVNENTANLPVNLEIADFVQTFTDGTLVKQLCHGSNDGYERIYMRTLVNEVWSSWMVPINGNTITLTGGAFGAAVFDADGNTTIETSTKPETGFGENKFLGL